MVLVVVIWLKEEMWSENFLPERFCIPLSLNAARVVDELKSLRSRIDDRRALGFGYPRGDVVLVVGGVENANGGGACGSRTNGFGK